MRKVDWIFQEYELETNNSEALKEANNLQSDTILAGQKLIIAGE